MFTFEHGEGSKYTMMEVLLIVLLATQYLAEGYEVVDTIIEQSASTKIIADMARLVLTSLLIEQASL